MAIDHGGADVAHHIVGPGNRGVGEQRHHRFQAAPGDEDQADLGVLVDQAVQAVALLGVACQEGAVQVGRQDQARIGPGLGGAG
ncbi:hypothetical protein QE386_001801 [Pseudoxanthomonas winnipegensis]|nr:hypothetical protein [Pseudoxanthomonas winnipegensis]